MTRAPQSSWRVGLAALAIALALPAKADDPRVAASAVIEGENILAHIRQLASDEFEGRAPGTRGEVLTTRYLASQFQSFGLKPGNPDGTYFQDVPLVGYRTVPQIRISAGGTRIALRYPEDFVHDFPALRASARISGAGVVFAGYGIVAPDYGWDDYRNLDVRNKLVIVMSGEPSRARGDGSAALDPAFFKGDQRTWYSTREFKFGVAAAKGAAGILVVTDPAKAKTYSLFQGFAKLEGAALKPARNDSPTLISGLITLDAARRVMRLAGVDFDVLQAAAATSDFHALQPNARADIRVTSRIRRFVSRNVVARVEGSDAAQRDEYLVYSAHWDHLGRDDTLVGDQIYNGAVDNAAGTAQMLEIARAFAAMPRKPRRSILFIATTAEEKGYLGARHYAQHPLYPLDRTVANINIDGGNLWGVTSDVVEAGVALSTLDEVLRDAARLQGRTFVEEAIDDGGMYFASDQIEFAKVGVPAAFPFNGTQYVGRPKDYGESKWSEFSRNDYHKVSDEPKADWDTSGAEADAKWLMIAGVLVADAEQRPEWKAGSEFGRRETASAGTRRASPNSR